MELSFSIFGKLKLKTNEVVHSLVHIPFSLYLDVLSIKWFSKVFLFKNILKQFLFIIFIVNINILKSPKKLKKSI